MIGEFELSNSIYANIYFLFRIQLSMCFRAFLLYIAKKYLQLYEIFILNIEDNFID